MALESKPHFHPEVIRQQVRSFSLPERVGDWQPKLQHWASHIACSAFTSSLRLQHVLCCGLMLHH